MEVDVKAGDVVVVPAGVSHRSLAAYGDYRYIGVYPEVCFDYILTPVVCREYSSDATGVFRKHPNGETTGARAERISTI